MHVNYNEVELINLEGEASRHGPVPLAVNLVELDAAANNLAAATGVLEAGDGDPGLVVQHPQQQRREDGDVPEIHLTPPLGRHLIPPVRYPRRQQHVLHMHTYTCMNPSIELTHMCYNL